MLSVTERKAASSMEQRTWAAVWIAFAIWLGLIAVAGSWVVSFLQSAVVPAPSTLEAVSGVVLYREADQRNEASAQEGVQLFEGDEIATSFGSRAVVSVLGGSTVELFPGTRLRVDAARVGRFNPGATQARLALSGGTLRLSVHEAARLQDIQIAVPHGVVAFAPGEYTVRGSAEATRVSVWFGRASLLAGIPKSEAHEGSKLILTPSGHAEVVHVLENVVRNGHFTDQMQDWEQWEDLEQGRPDVRGQMEVVSLSGSGGGKALRIRRNSARDAHNETGLRQRLDRDVGGARALRIEARLRVDDASLSGGGYLGSEYPIMLRVRLRDSRGGDVVWTQGFYYANPENRPVPIGMRVPRSEWVTFSTDLLQSVNQPATVESLEVFGAGHTFDALVSDVRLLVD